MVTRTLTTKPKIRAQDEKIGGTVQSVDRALRILEVLAHAGGAESLANICSATGLNASTCHHLISTLEHRRFVVKGATRGSYKLGPQTLVIAAAFKDGGDLASRAEPFIDKINEVTGEAVHLACLQDDDLVTLIRREARHAVRVDTGMVGKSRASHATATGKAILANLAEADLMRILTTKGMTRFTPKTITEPEVLLKELRVVRETGYAVDNEEFQPHVVCIGAAIISGAGAVLGAISASTPIMRADEDYLARVRQEVVAAAQAVSAAY